MIATTEIQNTRRDRLAWLTGAIGVAVLAWLSLAVHWITPIAIAAAVAGAIVFLRRPWLGLALVIASVPIQQFGAIGPVTITRACIPLAIVGYLIWLTVGRQPLKLTRLAIPLMLWLVWITGTVYVADDRSAAGSEVARWVIAAGTFIIASQFLIGAPRNRTVAIVGFMAVAGALEATIGTILSLLAFGPESFQVGDAFSRAYGTFGRPNTFAGYLEMTVFPVAWLTVDQIWRSVPTVRTYLAERQQGVVASCRTRQQSMKALLLIALLGGSSAIMLAGILASYSRGAWLGVVIGAAFSGLLFLRRAWLLIVAAAPIVMLVLVSGVVAIAPAALTDRLTSITDELRPFDASSIPITGDNFAVVERMAHWQAGWNMFVDRPLAGMGVGNYNHAYPDYYVRADFIHSQGHAHNYYIHVLAETGLIGLMLYLTVSLGFLFLAIIVAWNAPAGLPRFLALGAVGSMTAIMVHNLFENLHVLNMGIQISAVWALALAAHHGWRSGAHDSEIQNMEYSRG